MGPPALPILHEFPALNSRVLSQMEEDRQALQKLGTTGSSRVYQVFEQFFIGSGRSPNIDCVEKVNNYAQEFVEAAENALAGFIDENKAATTTNHLSVLNDAEIVDVHVFLSK
ncbi:Fc.00g066710.m01.CDS01 [Cosmosporella sp. VM-42]